MVASRRLSAPRTGVVAELAGAVLHRDDRGRFRVDFEHEPELEGQRDARVVEATRRGVARVLGRVEVIDRALDPRVQTAVREPAAYLTEALGPRSTQDDPRWDQAATTIERCRHGVLGVNPGELLDNTHGRDAAIGLRPKDPTAGQAWDDVRSAIDRHHSTDIELSVPRITR